MSKKVQESPEDVLKKSAKIILMIWNQIASDLKNKQRQFGDNDKKKLSRRFLKISKRKECNNNRNRGYRGMDKYMASDIILMRLKMPY